MRIMALDLGERRIGVALSDPLGWLATPLTVIRASSRQAAIEAIRGLVAKHKVEQVVVGYPRNLDGSIGPQALRVDRWVEDLCACLTCAGTGAAQGGETVRGTPVTLWDERLSTVEAERLIHETGRRIDRERIDAAAAAVILQSYLDAHRQ